MKSNEDSGHPRSLRKAIPYLAFNLVGSSLAVSLVPLQEGVPLGEFGIFLSLPSLLLVSYKMLNPRPYLFPALLLYGMSAIFTIAAVTLWLA